MTTNVEKYGEERNNKNKVSVRSIYSGPLPPPGMLKAYNDVVPGSGNDILNEFKKQGKHRRFVEKLIVFGKLFFIPVVPLLIILVAFYIGYLLIKSDKQTEGFIALLGPLGVLAGLFIWGKKRKE